ncbi:MAG TPA: ATP-binding protein [Actinomycetota bacterium]|nr:ATP-binding protein [Actinomycetota bacterium]
MNQEDQHDRLVIELPAEAEAVGSARLFATSVARLFGVDDEVVEDIRLAISEAVTERVQSAASEDAPVCVSTIVREKELVFEISGGSRTAGENGELGIAVVHSLFPDAVVEQDPHVLRFVAPRATAGSQAP